jgi:hypothetical protein
LGFTPAATPIAMIKREKIADGELGYFENGPLYEEYKKTLKGAYDDVVFAIPSL